MEKPTLDVVLQALDTLYGGEDIHPAEKQKASSWLVQLTASVSELMDNFYIIHTVYHGTYGILVYGACMVYSDWV